MQQNNENGEDLDGPPTINNITEDDLTYTTFNYNSDDDDDDDDDDGDNIEKKRINIYDHGENDMNGEDGDEQESHHHSLPEYASAVDINTSKIIGTRQISSLWQTLCGGCNSLSVVLSLGLAGCIIALISKNGQQSVKSIDVLLGEASWAALPSGKTPLSSIAFGSCSDQKLPMTYWDTLSFLRPDVTILMGDNVYGYCDESNCQLLEEAYNDLAMHPSFIGARATLPMIATLDNHDYGRNDANENEEMKDVAKEMFLDFFAVPENDERRSRPNDGVYTSYEWGPDGQRVQVILLDVRYHHSEFKKTDDYNAPLKERYVPDDDEEKRLMSEAQWGWLSGLLARPANVRLIVSSIQVIADGHGFECWRMIPHERERLYKTLQPTLEKSRTVLLSGDRHVGGFYKHETEDLYEVTSSSWTHTIPFGAYNDCSNAEECDEKDPRRLDNFVRVNHFGMVDLDWENRKMTVGLRRVDTTLEAKYKKDGVKPGDTVQYQTFAIP